MSEESVSLLQAECTTGDENYAASLNSPDQVLLRYENEAYSETVPSEYSGNENITIVDLPGVSNSDQPDDTCIKLQDGKEAHFFVSYSSEDRWRVVPMIENLEKDYNVRCLFDERDFQPGMQIHENIKRAIEKSMKMLVFLSEEFIKSNFCKYEIDQAFALAMETEVNNVLPVLLEDCDIPSTIKTLTYIDATSYVTYSEVSARIMEALNRKETASTENERLNRAIENGYYIDLVDEERPPCYCSGLCKEKEAFLSHYTMQAIKAGQFKVPLKTFQEAVDIVNCFRMRKRWSRFSKCRQAGICFWLIGLVWLVCLLLYAVLGLTLYSRGVSMTTMRIEKMWSSSQVGWTMVTVPIVLSSILVPLYYRCRQRRDLKNLKMRIFQEITMETYKQGALFKIMCLGTKCDIFTTLRVIRYNVHPCLKFLAKHIKESVEKKLNKTVDSSEIFDTLADNLLRRHLPLLIDAPLEDAPVIRHPVKAGKACFCQFLELQVNDTYIEPICEMFNDE